MRSQKNILIIEDDSDIRSLYTELLEGEGFKVKEAADGEKGKKMALAGGWDLCLLDLVLPKIDGMGILESIKKSEKVKDNPVLLLTNMDSKSVLDRSRSLGVAGVVIKSNVTPDEIIEKVKATLA
jgi:DNA-binding response OmpR family regulator